MFNSVAILAKTVIHTVLDQYQNGTPYRFKVRVHGLGMLQIYLPNDARIHVWDRSLMTPQVSEIHSHSWGFKSIVVSGVVRQKRYFSHEGPKTLLDLPSQYHQAVITPGPNPEPRAVELVWVSAGDTEVYNRGQYYTQEKNVLHASAPEDGTVTVVERERDPDREDDLAFVLWSVHSKFVSAAPRKPTPEEALRTLTLALSRMDS